jgi:glutathione S-transferase
MARARAQGLPYTLRVLSFSEGDLATPEFGALNPRRKVPVLDDGGFAIYESAAIIEYLDDAYRDVGAPLFPAELRARAVARRKIREADEYVASSMERLADQLLSAHPKRGIRRRSEKRASVSSTSSISSSAS